VDQYDAAFAASDDAGSPDLGNEPAQHACAPIQSDPACKMGKPMAMYPFLVKHVKDGRPACGRKESRLSGFGLGERLLSFTWKRRVRAVVLVAALVGLIFGGLIGCGLLTGERPGGSRADMRLGPTGADDEAKCPTANSINSVVTMDVSPTASAFKVTTTLEVKIKGVLPPSPTYAGNGQKQDRPDDLMFLTTCLAPVGFPYLVKSIGWHEGEIAATFALLPFQVLPIVQDNQGHINGVEIGVSLFRRTDLWLRLCAPPPIFDDGTEATEDRPEPEPNEQEQRSSDEHYVPYICRNRALTTINVSIGHGASNPAAGGPFFGLGHGPTLPTVRAESGQCLCNLSAFPAPAQASVKDDAEILSWQFVGKVTPVEIWVDAPFRLRAGIVTNSAVYPLGHWGIVSVSYLSYASAALAAILSAAMLLSSVADSRGSRWVVWSKIAAVVVGVLLLGGLVVTRDQFPLPASDSLSSGLVGSTLILLGLTGAKGRLTRFALGTLLAAGTVTIVLKDFPPPEWEPTADAALGASLILVATAVALVVIERTMSTVRKCGAGRNRTIAIFSGLTAFGFFTAFAYAAAFGGSAAIHGYADYVSISNTAADYEADNPPALWVRMEAFVRGASTVLPHMLSVAIVQVLPLIAISLLIGIWLENFDASLRWISWIKWWRRRAVRRMHLKKTGARTFPTKWVVALLLSLAAPWSETGVVGFVVMVPMWLVQFGVLILALQFITDNLPASVRIADRVPLAAVQGERAALLRSVRQPPQSKPDGGYSHTEASRLLELGPKGDPLANAMFASRVALGLAIVPIAYLALTAIDVSRGNTWTMGFFFASTSVLAEATRWLVTGFIYGFLHPRLPGKTGPAKALCFALLWAISAWAAVAVARVGGAEVVAPAIYRTAEFALVVVILGLLLDLGSVRQAGGTWRDLRQVYLRHNYVQIAAIVAPVLLSVFTLISQVASGAGLNAARTVVNGASQVVTAPGAGSSARGAG
jgi:Family of unknown function (DUF6185)